MEDILFLVCFLGTPVVMVVVLAVLAPRRVLAAPCPEAVPLATIQAGTGGALERVALGALGGGFRQVLGSAWGWAMVVAPDAPAGWFNGERALVLKTALAGGERVHFRDDVLVLSSDGPPTAEDMARAVDRALGAAC